MSNICIREHIRAYVFVCIYITMHYCTTSYRMLSTEHYTDIPVYFMCVLFKGPFPLVRFNPRGWTRAGRRGCYIIQPSLNPCIISIHAEPSRVICRAGRKSNNVRFYPHRMAKTHGEFQKMSSHRWADNYLIICKYGKRNPIFNTIKGGQEICGRKILRN